MLQPQPTSAAGVPGRLVVVGEAVLDVTAWIDAPPVRGGDRLATAAALTPGGGFNVMAAAARLGLLVLFAGRHGAGPTGDLVRAALAAEGIEVLRAPDPAADSGFVVSLVEPDGERTFVTSPAALQALDPAALAAVPVGPGDIVYVSGYGLVSPHGADLVAWVADLDRSVIVVADPGPLGADAPADLLAGLRSRADWWSCNRREATALTGIDDPAGAARALVVPRSEPADLARAAGVVAGVAGTTPVLPGGVIVRDGPGGCVVVLRADPTTAVRIPAPVVEAVDTTGAGDTHVGVLAAALAAGLAPLDAARRATVAAALSVTRRGPATAPHPDELATALARAPDGEQAPLRRDGQALPPLRFRDATGADVDAIVALVESAYRGEASRGGWTTEADLLGGVRTDAATVAAEIADPRSILLLADRADGPDRADRADRADGHGGLVACCHLRHDGPAAYFGMFAVRPGTQGAGIGRAVVAEARRRVVAQWRCREMWMTVIRQRTELIAWYERLGFRLTGETEPFPYGDERFGQPKRDDLEFVVLRRSLG